MIPATVSPRLNTTILPHVSLTDPTLLTSILSPRAPKPFTPQIIHATLHPRHQPPHDTYARRPPFRSPPQRGPPQNRLVSRNAPSLLRPRYRSIPHHQRAQPTHRRHRIAHESRTPSRLTGLGAIRTSQDTGTF